MQLFPKHWELLVTPHAPTSPWCSAWSTVTCMLMCLCMLCILAYCIDDFFYLFCLVLDFSLTFVDKEVGTFGFACTFVFCFVLDATLTFIVWTKVGTFYFVCSFFSQFVSFCFGMHKQKQLKHLCFVLPSLLTFTDKTCWKKTEKRGRKK